MSRPPQELEALVERALAEDAPTGDITAALVVPEGATCRAELRAKATGIVAGTAAAQAAFDVAAHQDSLGPVRVEWRTHDGDEAKSGDVVATISGPARTVLRAER